MKYQIALIRGDGIGPEVVNEAVGVLEAVGKKFGHTYEFVDVLLGGCATDAVGKSYPDGTADPVSYTHLDVYKRQLQYPVPGQL